MSESASTEAAQPFLDVEDRKAASSGSSHAKTWPATATSSQTMRRGLLYLGTITLLFAVILFQALALSNYKPKQPTGNEFGGCGTSIAEARAKGCQFEPMSWQWIPPQCYYGDLIESFLSRTEWHFYRNYTLEAADEIDMEEIIAGDHEVVYTPDQYHPIHCTYMWIKVHTAFVQKLPLDNGVVSLGHTNHCATNVLNPYTNELGPGNCTGGVCATRLSVRFNTCGYY